MKNIVSCIKANKAAQKLAALLLCCVLLAGCDGPAPSAGVSASPSATLGGGGKISTDSIVLPMPENAELANPLMSATREMESIYSLIYEGLLTTDDSGALVPCLAQKIPDKADSDDGLTWTFTLRKGVKWQGTGKELTAADVVYTLEQIKALGTSQPWGYVTKNYIKNWKANDDGTLTLSLYKPFYGALEGLTFPVIPESAGYDGGAAPNPPVGTGAYQVKAYEKGKSISLSAYPDWWKKQPAIKTVKVLPFPDNDTEISSLTLGSGQLDAVQTDDLTVAQYRDSGDANIYEYPTRDFEYMALNFSVQDLQDKNIRQAIAYALDRKEIVSYTYVNHAIVVDTPTPPDSWLYNGKVLQYSLDTDQAKRLIELAGWKKANKDDPYYDISPDGVNRNLKFTLLANMQENNTLRHDAAMLITGQLAKAGIEVTVDAENWDTYNTMLKQGRFDLALCGCYLSSIPDYSFLIGSKGAMNLGKYNSADMDAALAAVLQSPDSKTLQVNIGALQAKIISDLPIISLYFRTHSLLTTPGIRGVAGVKEESAFSGISQWTTGG